MGPKTIIRDSCDWSKFSVVFGDFMFKYIIIAISDNLRLATLQGKKGKEKNLVYLTGFSSKLLFNLAEHPTLF